MLAPRAYELCPELYGMNDCGNISTLTAIATLVGKIIAAAIEGAGQRAAMNGLPSARLIENSNAQEDSPAR